jgi:hypothetical protein
LATSQLIFKSKSPGFIERITTQTTPTPHSGTSNGVEGKKDDSQASLFAKYCLSGLFSLPECEVEAGWPLIVPGELQVGGHPNHGQRPVNVI